MVIPIHIPYYQMHNSNSNKLVYYYNEWLPIFFTTTTAIGLLTGLMTCGYCNKKDLFPYIVGNLSIGVITGITYPVSFPFLGAYVLYKNYK